MTRNEALKVNPNITYIDESIDLKTVYAVEWIDNRKDLERINRHPAPWELYKKKETENLQRALESFMVLYVRERNENDHIYDVKLSETITLNGEIIREQYLFDVYGLYGLLDAETRRIETRYYEEKEAAEKQDSRIGGFIRKFNAREYWERYNKEENEKEAMMT